MTMKGPIYIRGMGGGTGWATCRTTLEIKLIQAEERVCQVRDSHLSREKGTGAETPFAVVSPHQTTESFTECSRRGSCRQGRR